MIKCEMQSYTRSGKYKKMCKTFSCRENCTRSKIWALFLQQPWHDSSSCCSRDRASNIFPKAIWYSILQYSRAFQIARNHDISHSKTRNKRRTTACSFSILNYWHQNHPRSSWQTGAGGGVVTYQLTKTSANSYATNPKHLHKKKTQPRSAELGHRSGDRRNLQLRTRGASLLLLHTASSSSSSDAQKTPL